MTKETLLGAIVLFTLTPACESHQPVPVDDCRKVVSHAKKLLGDQADPVSKLVAQCQAASDQDRGCVMVADSAADILRCSM